LPDHVFIEEGFHFLRLGQVVRRRRRVRFRAIVFKYGVANCDAFITDVGPGIITGGRNEFGDSIL